MNNANDKERVRLAMTPLDARPGVDVRWPAPVVQA